MIRFFKCQILFSVEFIVCASLVCGCRIYISFASADGHIVLEQSKKKLVASYT